MVLLAQDMRELANWQPISSSEPLTSPVTDFLGNAVSVPMSERWHISSLQIINTGSVSRSLKMWAVPYDSTITNSDESTWLWIPNVSVAAGTIESLGPMEGLEVIRILEPGFGIFANALNDLNIILFGWRVPV